MSDLKIMMMKIMMMKTDMKFRILDVEDIDMYDYPDFCDAYCVEAEVLDNGEWREATEGELDIINNEYSESINEAIHDNGLYL